VTAGGGALCTLGNTPFALLRPSLAELARKLRLDIGQQAVRDGHEIALGVCSGCECRNPIHLTRPGIFMDQPAEAPSRTTCTLAAGMGSGTAPEVDEQMRGCCATTLWSGDGHAQDLASGGLDHQPHLQSPEQDRFDVDRSPARMPVAWTDRNCRHLKPARRGADSMPARWSSDIMLVASLSPSWVRSPWMRRS
jgi:hypothetical protein